MNNPCPMGGQGFRLHSAMRRIQRALPFFAGKAPARVFSDQAAVDSIFVAKVKSTVRDAASTTVVMMGLAIRAGST